MTTAALPSAMAAAERLLRRGDVEGALGVRRALWVADAPLPAEATPPPSSGLEPRLRAALEYPVDEAPGLTRAARDEVRVALALGTLFGIGVPALTIRLWPALSGERFRFPALDAHVRRLRETGAQPHDPLLVRLLGEAGGPPNERVRAELLVQHAYHWVLLGVTLGELEAQLLARPPRIAAVRVQALRPSGCPVCTWPAGAYPAPEVARLPRLPAHPGCHCVYRAVLLPG